MATKEANGGNGAATNKDVVQGTGTYKDGLVAPKKDQRYRTEDVTDTKGRDWDDFFLRRELLMGIFEKGFEKPSPIQEEAIPVILQNRNVLARAKNGTGKTAAYIIPCLEKTDSTKNHIQGTIYWRGMWCFCFEFCVSLFHHAVFVFVIGGAAGRFALDFCRHGTKITHLFALICNLDPFSVLERSSYLDPDARTRAPDIRHRQGNRQAHGSPMHGYHRRHLPQGRHYASL